MQHEATFTAQRVRLHESVAPILFSRVLLIGCSDYQRAATTVTAQGADFGVTSVVKIMSMP